MMTDYRKQQFKYILADLLSAEIVWMSFLLFRWLVYEGKVFGFSTVLIPAFDFVQPLIIYPIACIIIHYLSGYYIRPIYKTYGKELLTTLVSALVIAFGAFFIIIIDDEVKHYQNYLVSMGVLAGLQFFVTYLLRVGITWHNHRKGLKPEEVILQLSDNEDENALYRRISEVYPTGKDILVVPRVFDILTGAAHISELGKSPYICITDTHMTDAGMCIKRAFDVSVSVIAIIILSPFWIILAICIKATSPGKIIYKQERIGLHGKAFMILKFRTMYDNAESDKPQLSQDNDPRITPLGKVLRKYRLDESPQFWNVLKGDMSLVGPRPERQYFITQIMEQAPYYCLLYKIRPGLTSWGPIKVGYTDTIAKMIERLNYDIAYMENQSILLDIKILLHTTKVIFNGEGK